jgi:mutator protein MutT
MSTSIKRGADVVAALIEHYLDKEHFLVQYRPLNKPSGYYPGWLEFPGGKVETTDVTLEAALIREVFEEVGVVVTGMKKLCSMDYVFPSGISHHIHFFVIAPNEYLGVPEGKENQRIGYLTLYQLMTYNKMLPLNRAAALILTTERHPDILD